MDDDVINVERKRPTDEMSVKLNEVEVGLLCLVQVRLIWRKTLRTWESGKLEDKLKATAKRRSTSIGSGTKPIK
jgi:hypothetical protein